MIGPFVNVDLFSAEFMSLWNGYFEPVVKLLKLTLKSKESAYQLTLYCIFIGKNISNLKKLNQNWLLSNQIK